MRSAGKRVVVVRSPAIIALALLAGACVQLGDIQQTQPIVVMGFTGSHKTVAQCVHQRLGGRLSDVSFGEKYVIYDAVKGRSAEGLTHYSITVGKSGPDEGFAEWRIITPATSRRGPRSLRLTPAAMQEYWTPVQDCAARAKGSQ